MDQTQGQGDVASGFQLQMTLGNGSQMGLPGIDDDQVGPFFYGLCQAESNDPFLIALKKIAAPIQNKTGWDIIIRDREKAAGDLTGDFPGHVADMLRAADIGRPEDIGQTDQDEMFQSLRSPLGKDHGFRPMFPTDAVQIFGDKMKGLGPGYRLPLVSTTRPLSEQRPGQTIGVDRSLERSQAFGTDIPMADRTLGIPFDRFDPALLDFDQETAPPMIHSRAVGFEDLGFGVFAGHRGSFIGELNQSH